MFGRLRAYFCVSLCINFPSLNNGFMPKVFTPVVRHSNARWLRLRFFARAIRILVLTRRVLCRVFSLEPLKGYQGEDIEIQLPRSLTMHSIDWLAVWCVQYTHNFGHVNIPDDLDVPPALGQTKLTVSNSKTKLKREPPINEFPWYFGFQHSLWRNIPPFR